MRTAADDDGGGGVSPFSAKSFTVTALLSLALLISLLRLRRLPPAATAAAGSIVVAIVVYDVADVINGEEVVEVDVCGTARRR
jgi:hypothetical protein